MQYKRALFAAWLGLSAPAWAADEPLVAPVAAWVEPVSIPSPKRELNSKAAQFLLSNAQTRYAMTGDEFYVETAIVAQNPQGLAELGTVTIPWQPDSADLIVHKAHILRGGKVIDLLAGGQKFTVLRRENKLEQAMLDGTLTAVLQPQGLQVGDTLNLAFTYRTKPGSIPFAPENLVALPTGMPLRKAFYRQIWPADTQMKWRSTPAMGTPKVRQTKLGTELVLDLENVELPARPADAPQRFHLPAVLQLSAYKDWNAVSALFAPVYAEAGKLPLNAELRAEVAKIAASTPDPRRRAMKALRLVQDRVRYVALAMGEGGYVPAGVNETWSRKYGDCKAKTVMLIALLKELGIAAEPVLVSTGLADTLGESLPQVKPFDHVIVRATIDGRSYWMDGTRSGDRRIDDLASSSYRWGLPVRAPGAALEQLPIAPPSLPLIETRITYDASNGFFTPVGVTGELIFRGDEAAMLRGAADELGAEEFKKKAAELVEKLPGGKDFNLTFKSDEEEGAFTISYIGRQEMSWTAAHRRSA